MSFVHRALNSFTKCELSKCFVFPTWPVTSGFFGNSFSADPKLGTGALQGNVACPCFKKILEAKSWIWMLCCVTQLWFHRGAIKRSIGNGPRLSFNCTTQNLLPEKAALVFWPQCCTARLLIAAFHCVLFVFFLGGYALLGHVHKHCNSWYFYHIILNKHLCTFWLLLVYIYL